MSTSSYVATIDSILGQNPAQGVQRIQSKVDELLTPRNKRIVLFGSGTLGRHVLSRLRKMCVEPVAFADNNPQLWGKHVEGVPVFGPEESVARFGATAVFVVTVYTNGPVLRQAQALRIQPLAFPELAWRFSDHFLPHGCLELPHKLVEQKSDIRRAAELWTDEASRREYAGQLAWRFSLERSHLPAADNPQNIYFPEELIVPLEKEVFVDCGAFDGDSVRSFLRRRNHTFETIFALEPDPQNCKQLQTFLGSLPGPTREKVTVLQRAVGQRSEVVRFNATGTAGSAVGSGEFEVEVVRLDDALRNEHPTYIKMDIEGAELDALQGGSHLIAENCPVLAICLYHVQEHLWQIPLFIHSLNNRYRFFLRRYSDECWEQVCYAIPVERLPPGIA